MEGAIIYCLNTILPMLLGNTIINCFINRAVLLAVGSNHSLSVPGMVNILPRKFTKISVC